MQGIYSGITILDLTKVFSGPFCTRLFADYGAEVIKIESADFQDDTRNYPPVKNDHSGYYEMLNRNKKGVSLNLKISSDLQKFYDICKRADVIVENLLPNTKFKLKIDYETIKKINPQIIYASLSGKGQDYNEKYYDVLAQAESGMVSLTGVPETPTKISPAVVDAFSGLMLAFGISGALLYKKQSGIGQVVNVSMLGSAMQLLESNLTATSITGSNPVRTGNQDNLISPFGIYKAGDGYIAIAAGNEKQWEVLLKFLQAHTEINTADFSSNDLRLQNVNSLTSIIEKSFTIYKVADLINKLHSLNIACAPVNNMTDILQNSDLISSQELIKVDHPKLGSVVVPGFPIKFSQTEAIITNNAPEIGENNSEYGLS